jgi:hypothetical protein
LFVLILIYGEYWKVWSIGVFFVGGIMVFFFFLLLEDAD